MKLLNVGGFRCHLLLPHEVVGTIDDDHPTFRGLTVEGGVFFRNGKPVLRVSKDRDDKRLRVLVKALAEVWIQEPGLSVKIAGNGIWRGLGPRGKWTSPPYPLTKKRTASGVSQAYRSTVHFPRVKTNPNYTTGVEYREGGKTWRWHSDGGFAKPLLRKAEQVPWPGCEVFSEGYELRGTFDSPSQRALRRWEIAPHGPNRLYPDPDQAWMHFFGWVGGPGTVVNENGRTPPPGMDVTAADGYDRLFDPRSWRRLRAGQSIAQTLR